MEKFNANVKERYNRCLDTYKTACNILNIDASDDVNNTSTDVVEAVKNLEEKLRHLVYEKFYYNWIKAVEENFEEDQRGSIYGLLDTMLKSDPSTIFNSFNFTYEILEKLNDKKSREDCLKEIENNSTSIERAVNDYSILFYSKHAGDVIKAIRNGLEKDPKIAPYVPNLFGTKSQQEREEVPELVGAKVKTEE